MRLFIALDIDDAIRERITRFMEGVSGFAPEARWVRAESLHVTLKFIGERPDDSVGAIKQTVAKVKSDKFELSFRGYGFFPTPRSARVFWVGMEAGPELSRLAAAVDEATAASGIEKEKHVYNPHLTLARGGHGSGAPGRQKSDRSNNNFQKLQERLPAIAAPEFGTMTAREFFLYRSELMRGGARYMKIERFPLGE